MALIHLPSQQKDSFGKRFGNAFNPALQKGLERYAEEEASKRKSAREALFEQKKELRQTQAEIEKEKRKDLAEKKMLEEEDTALQKLGADTKGIRNPTIRQKLLEETREKEGITQKSNRLDAILKDIPEDQLSQRDRALLKASMLDTGASGSITQLLKPPVAGKVAPQTPFQKAKGTLAAKKYEEAQEQLPKIDSTLQNIGRMRELTPQISGPYGTIKSLFNSKEAAEFDALGLSLIEPVLKIFNPVGAIPTQKINLIRAQFAPKSSDFQNTIQGKLNVLERLATQAQQRNQERIALYDAYDGDPPPEALRQFDKQSSKILDSEISQGKAQVRESKAASEAENAQLPDPIANKGKTIRNSETGQRMTSNGFNWIPS